MLKWIVGSKVDHPLAEPKQARALIAELPAHDYLKALDEITRWLQSLNEAEGFKLDRLFEIVDLLDTTAKNHQRRLASDYLGMSRQQKFQENKLWTCAYNFAQALGETYVSCVRQYQNGASGAGAIKKHIPVIVGRAFRTLGLQVKWTMLRYGPFQAGLWKSIGELYRFADAGGFSATPIAIYPGAQGTGTVEQEYLKVMMLWASSADVLPPLKQEIAERASAHFAPAFRAGKAPFEGAICVFDFSGTRPPKRRFADSAPAASLSYFGPGEAPAKIARMIAAIEQKGAAPAELTLGAAYPAEMILGVLKHLAVYWSDKPPSRASERRETMARITIVPGYFAVLDELERDESDALNFSVSSGESWIVENVSDNGYGALVPASTTDWIRVGEMIGVQVEGAQQWGIGLIRRVMRDEQRQYHVGIEIIARSAVTVRFSPGQPGREPENAVLLSATPDVNGEVGLVMRAGRYDPNLNLHVIGQTKSHVFQPSRMMDAGGDYDWAMFKVVSPDA